MKSSDPETILLARTERDSPVAAGAIFVKDARIPKNIIYI